MPNQFSVQPANISMGLKGALMGLEARNLNQQKAQEQAKQGQVMAQAQELMRSGNPQDIASFVLANPEIGGRIREGVNYRSKETEDARRTAMMNIMTGANPTETVQNLVAEITRLGGDPSETQRLLQLSDEEIRKRTEEQLPWMDEKEVSETKKLQAETKLLEQKFKSLADPLTPPEDKLKIEKDLRQEVFSRSKAFETVDDAYDRIRVSAKDPSPAGDLALIFNYMKILDPGSTVREGEFATAQQAGSIDDRTISLYNRIVSGTRLSARQRTDFVKRAKSLFGAAKSKQDKLTSRYESLAGRYGVDPRNVILGNDSEVLSDEDLVNKYL